MKYYAVSIPKFGENQSEDSYCIHAEKNCFVVADGAGGVGIFAKEWADTLTRAISSVEQANPEYIKALKIKFYNEREQFLDLNLDYFADKFFQEGSASTLVLADFGVDLWEMEYHFYAQGQSILSEHNQQFLYPLKLWAYGDSGIFVYQKATNNIETNLGIQHFVNAPYLINCIEPELNVAKIYTKALYVSKGDIVILASDAIALYLRLIMAFEQKDEEMLQKIIHQGSAFSERVWLMKNMQNLPTFYQAIQSFLQNMTSDEQFSSYCQFLQTQNLIDYDDYTLLVIII